MHVLAHVSEVAVKSREGTGTDHPEKTSQSIQQAGNPIPSPLPAPVPVLDEETVRQLKLP